MHSRPSSRASEVPNDLDSSFSSYQKLNASSMSAHRHDCQRRCHFNHLNSSFSVGARENDARSEFNYQPREFLSGHRDGNRRRNKGMPYPGLSVSMPASPMPEISLLKMVTNMQMFAKSGKKTSGSNLMCSSPKRSSRKRHVGHTPFSRLCLDVSSDESL